MAIFALLILQRRLEFWRNPYAAFSVHTLPLFHHFQFH